MIETWDSGFITEGDIMVQAGKSSVREMAKDSATYPISEVLKVAEMVGSTENLKNLEPFMHSEDASVRFWSLNAIDAFNGDIYPQKNNLLTALKDPSLPNAGLAAEILINKLDGPKEAFAALSRLLREAKNEV